MSGGIFKDKLIYDATTPADGDSLAAFLHATNKLTSTTIGPVEALDVNISNTSVVVSATDLDIRDLVFATDKVDVTGSTVALDAGTLAALESITVTGAVAATGNVADDAVDSGNPVKTGTRAISGALPAISTTGDRADMISDLFRRLWVNTAPNVGASNGALVLSDTVGGTAVFASPLAGRQRVQVQNNDNKPIYLGFGAVTALTGIKVNAGATWTEMLGPDQALKAISTAGQTTADVRVFQLA